MDWGRVALIFLVMFAFVGNNEEKKRDVLILEFCEENGLSGVYKGSCAYHDDHGNTIGQERVMVRDGVVTWPEVPRDKILDLGISSNMTTFQQGYFWIIWIFFFTLFPYYYEKLEMNQ